MKNYIKLVVIALFAVATLSSQTTTPFNNEMPETWKPDMSNSHTRRSVNPRQTQHQYTPAELSKGRQYNVINTETKVNTPTSVTLQNNSNNGYYRSYGINHNDAQNVTYNSPTQVEPITINATEATPFDDVVAIDGMMHVDRNNKPSDPAPIGDVALPLLLIAAAYVAIKLRVEN